MNEEPKIKPPTIVPKSSARVLTSEELMQRLKEKEQSKRKKEEEKEQRKLEKEKQKAEKAAQG